MGSYAVHVRWRHLNLGLRLGEVLIKEMVIDVFLESNLIEML